MDRRLFFKYMGYGSAGTLAVPSWLTGCGINGNGGGDSAVSFDGIMPIAASIDCSKLLLASGKAEGIYRELLTGNINLNIPGNLSRLGSSIPFDEEMVLAYFEEFGRSWDPESGANLMKGSLLFGWFMFHPLRKSMSEVYRKLVNQGYHYDTLTLYYDTYMIRQVAGGQGPAGLDTRDMQAFLNGILPRMVTRVHTLKPDYLDGPGWVNRMGQWRSHNKEQMQMRGAMFQEDDPDMHDKLIARYNVYQPEDRLIQLVRGMNGSISPGSLEKLILSDPGNSIYTRSLVSGYKHILTAIDFLEGRSGMEELKKQL